MFLALYGKNISSEQLQVLTPRFMSWQDDVWLFDLGVCQSYWQTQAEGLQKDLTGLYREVLQKTFGRDFAAVLASNPWQAALLITYMRERQLHGFIDAHGAFGRSLYQNLSWESWWGTAKVFAGHCQSMKIKGFKPAGFQRECRQMQLAIERLGAGCPWEIEAVGAYAIKRRFGATMKQLWQWTWMSQDVPGDFPWQSFALPKKPVVKRVLDTPIYEWEHMQEFLREDFERLCTAKAIGVYEKAVSLELRLTLCDCSLLPIPICFRHPHSLHSQSPTHGTALLQAYYAYCHAQRDVGMTNEDHGIIAWELSVEECLTMPAQMLDLFGGAASERSDLLQLENRLPVALQAYDLSNDWVPENSYVNSDALELRLDSELNNAFLSLCAVAKKRPMFIYKEPLPLALEAKTFSTLWQFLERTMSKWWGSLSSQTNNQRDYYRFVDNEKRSLWIFKDTLGHWYVHGIFA